MKKQGIQSSLEHLMTCLLVRAKIGCGTTSLANISLPSSHTDQTGHGISYPVHIRTVHTYQWTRLPWTHSPRSHHDPSTTWPSEECSDGQSSREDCDDNQQQECSDDQPQDFREQPTSSELPTKVSIYSQVVLIIAPKFLQEHRCSLNYRSIEISRITLKEFHIQLW